MTTNDLIDKLARWEEPIVREPEYFFKTVQPLVRDIRAMLERQRETIATFTDIICSRDAEIENLKARIEMNVVETKRLAAESKRLVLLLAQK